MAKLQSAKISAFEARMADQDERITELEQRTSFLVGLGLSLGVGLLLFYWMNRHISQYSVKYMSHTGAEEQGCSR